ncbi:MAG: phycobiliprotein lyase, partial [Cyanobacteria bacterium J06598_3]
MVLSVISDTNFASPTSASSSAGSNAGSMAEQLAAVESQAIAFFQHSEGSWQSRRRYYTLANGQAQE